MLNIPSVHCQGQLTNSSTTTYTASTFSKVKEARSRSLPCFWGLKQHSNVSGFQTSASTSRPARPPASTEGWNSASHPSQAGNGLPLAGQQRPGAAVQQRGEPLIELRNVWKTFGSKAVLKGASIKIYRGEAVGIIGGSGTGKSTTLRLMAGLLMPDQGQVFIKGKARHGLLSDDPEIGKLLNVGMVFQNGALFDSLTVGQNVGFLLYEHTKLPHPKIQNIVADALASVGLSGVEDLMPSELSGGMRKRVALARAIVRDNDAENPDQVVMYDEPTAGLDPVASTVVEDLVRSLRVSHTAGTPQGQDSGGIAAYIVVTHQHSTIRRSVDRIIFLHEGKVVWEGPVEEFDTTNEPIVRQFASGALNGPIKYE